MKTKAYFFLAAFILMASLYMGCSKDEEETNVVVQSYSQAFVDVTKSMEDFVKKAQDYESTNYDQLTAQQTLTIINNYIASGEKLIADVAEMQKYKSPTKHSSPFTKSSLDNPCNKYDMLPGTDGGLSVSFMKSIADLIQETKGERALIQDKYDKGQITDDQYKEALKQLTKMKTIKTVNFGFSAVLGAGASGLSGAVIYSVGGIGATMSAPAIVAVTAVGAVVGTGYYVISNWYYGIQKNGQSDSSMYAVVAYGKVGDPIPSTLLKEGANLTIAVDGYAPVYIPSLALPALGNKKNLELKSVPLADAKAGTQIEVCTSEEPYTTQNCAEVLYVTGHPTPQDPGPGEGVTVTATIFPVVEGCSVSFSIVGTDGYTNSGTYSTDASGQASFYIPGGAQGVFDIVTITSANGLKYTVTYTF
jgi:hypothetical protein